MKIVIARYNEDIHWILPMIEYVVVYNKGKDDLDYIPQDKIIKCENIGREGHTYIKHILDNYDNLDDHTFFLQGKVHDHINGPSIESAHNFVFSLIHEPKTYNFKYISNCNIQVKKQEFTEYCSGLHGFPFRDIPEISTEKIKNFVNKIKNMPKVKEMLLLLNGKKTIKKHKLAKIIEDIGLEEPLRTELIKLYCYEDLFLKVYPNNTYSYGAGALFIASKKNIQLIPKNYWEEIISTMQTTCPSTGYGLEKMWRFLLE